jgi:hypothetical protein
MHELQSQLHEFLASGRRSQWLHGAGWKVYVRCSNRYLDGAMRRTFEIATVDVDQPGRGTFTRMLALCMAAAQANNFEMIYIESVGNPRLSKRFDKTGWASEGHVISPCYYKPLT